MSDNYQSEIRIIILLFLVACGLISITEAQNFPVLKGEYSGQKKPGMIPEQFAPGIITVYVHGRVAISPKGDEIFWSITQITERIVHSKLVDGTWTKPTLAEFVTDHLTVHNGDSVFSIDGARLYFRSNLPGGFGEHDVYFAEKTRDGWSNTSNAGMIYISSGGNSSPVFTTRGDAYRFRLNNLYKESSQCYKYTNDEFTYPVPVEEIPEYGPWWTIFISPKEDYLIFAGNRDNADLSIRFKNSRGEWGEPINMGDQINTEGWERFPVAPPDGKYLFFTRGGGSVSDLYWVSTEVINRLKKKIQ